MNKSTTTTNNINDTMVVRFKILWIWKQNPYVSIRILVGEIKQTVFFYSKHTLREKLSIIIIFLFFFMDRRKMSKAKLIKYNIQIGKTQRLIGSLEHIILKVFRRISRAYLEIPTSFWYQKYRDQKKYSRDLYNGDSIT